MKNLTEQPAWQALGRHYKTIAHQHMRDWFASEPNRFLRYSIQHDGLLLDYSRNRINDETLSLLIQLAEEIHLEAKIKALFAGDAVNTTEKRPALHTALRNEETNERKFLHDFVNDVHAGIRLGSTHKPFRHVVNIGIGGSYLGPQMCIQALKDFAVTPLKFHFLSTVDPDHIRDLQQEIDPETTLFIISSKSFTTIETLTNVNSMAEWLNSQLGADAFIKQAVAVTAKPAHAEAFGLPPNQIFTFKEGIGGRYSIWSAIGLPLMLMIGNKQFSEFLHGAKSMDDHFRQTPFISNMPFMLALLGIWYSNFFQASAEAIIPYSHRLRSFVAYIQQLEMESNGKSVTLNGEPAHYSTGAVIFGEEGCNGQHSFYQLLHQGKQFIPIESILVMTPHHAANQQHHDVVLASALSQAYALVNGKTREEAEMEMLAAGQTPAEAKALADHLAIDGNKPDNLVILDTLNPARLGSLIALYEHKIFTQGAIWNINPFDQWGVELGKKHLPAILKTLVNRDDNPFTDAATQHLINTLKQGKNRQ